MVLVGLLMYLLIRLVEPSSARETLAELVTRLEPELRERAAAARHLAVPLPEHDFQQLVEAAVHQRVPVNAETEECRAHSDLLANAVTRGETWALRILDSSSTLPGGLLDGQLIDMGHYHECIGTQEPNYLFKGKYCFVEARNILPQELHLHMNYDTSKYPREVAEIFTHPKDLTFSVCVPSSCSAQDVQVHMDRVLAPINASSAIYDSNCSTDESLPFTFKDWFAIAVFSSLILAVSFATIVDLQDSNHNSALVSSFSLPRNWKQLTNTRVVEEMSSMAGIRVIATVAVAMGHCTLKNIWDQTVSPLVLEKEARLSHLSWIELAGRTVDVFLLLGGTTRAYSFLKERAKEKPVEIIPPILRRYTRYSPSLAAVALFSATFLIRCGSGPFWKRQLNFPTWGCCNLWFTALLHISNLVTPPSSCIQPGWYLTIDFQLFLISPLFLLPLHYEPKVGLLIIVVGVATSLMSHTLAAIAIEVDAATITYLFKSRLKNEVTTLLYINTLYRLSSYLLGIALGFFLFSSDQHKSCVRLSKPVLWLGWLASLAAVVAVVAVTNMVLDPGYDRVHWIDVGFTVLAKPLIAAAVGWLVLVCHLGYGGLLNDFLSWRGFQPMSKLALGFYLVNYEIVRIQTNRMKSLIIYDRFYVLHMGVGVVMLSGLVAAVLFLFIEAPCSSLMSFYLRKRMTSAPAKYADNLVHSLNKPDGSKNKTEKDTEKKMKIS